MICWKLSKFNKISVKKR